MSLINLKNPKGIAVGVIMLVVAITILTQVLPELIGAIVNLSGISNLAFASFFGAGGVVLLLLSISILIAIFNMLGMGGGKK